LLGVAATCAAHLQSLFDAAGFRCAFVLKSQVPRDGQRWSPLEDYCEALGKSERT